MKPELFPRILVITGGMAAGKSTIAEAVARRLPRAVHVRGDLFRRMIVRGRVEMTPDAPLEAQRQLLLRYDLACSVAGQYAAAGFFVVYQGILLEEHRAYVIGKLSRWQPGVAVLAPSTATLARRDRQRVKSGYRDGWTPEMMAGALHERTPRIGLWIDSSAMSVTETVDFIFAQADKLRHGI